MSVSLLLAASVVPTDGRAARFIASPVVRNKPRGSRRSVVSWSQLEQLLRTKNLWDKPAQFAVMVILCFRDHEKRGYAFPSLAEIASLIGCKPGYVKKVVKELEALHAVARLGPEREHGGRNRYAVTLDVAVAAVRRGGPGYPGGGHQGDPGEGSQGDRGGCPWGPPVPDKEQEYVPKVQDARATAPPRLPLFGAVPPLRPQQHAIADVQRLRLEKLRRKVAGMARSILFNPALGRDLLNGEIATSIDSLIEATKRLCARKRVAGYGEVVHAMCTSELFKFRNPAVVAGLAPRPRDRRAVR